MTNHRITQFDARQDLERLTLVLAGSQLGIWDWDIRSGEVRRNERWAEILGYTLEQIEPTVMQGEDLVHPDDRPAARKSLQDHLDGRTQAHESEHRMRSNSGTYIWVHDIGRIIERDGQGRPTRMSGTHRDITERKQAEEALRAREHQYRGLVGNIPGMVYQAQPDWSAQIISHSEQLCGYTLEEFSSRAVNWRDIIHPDDSAWVKEEGAILADHQDNLVQEYRIIAKDGRTVWVSDHKSSVFTHEGKLERIDGVVFDMTARKETENKLRTFSRAVEQSLTTVMITAEDGVIEYVNPTFTRLSGYTSEEVIGKMPSISKSGVTTKEEYARMWETITGGGEWKGEFLNKRKNGELYWVSTSISPIRDANGAIRNYLAIQEDVTERKRIEEALAKQNEYLSALHDISLGILSHLSLEDVLRSVIQRSAKLIDRSCGAILLLDAERDALEVKVGTGMFEPAVGRHLRRGEGVGGKVWETGRPLVMDDGHWNGRGSHVPDDILFTQAGTPLISGSHVIGVLLIAHESNSGKTFGMSETEILQRLGHMASIGIDNARLYAEAQHARVSAESANTAKSNFLSSISHELRTPLNAILGFTQLLGRDPQLSAQQREYLGIVNQSGQHLVTLINDVLELSKIEAGHVTLNEKSFDLHETFRGIRELFYARIADKGLVLDHDVASDIPQYVSADETKLRQILMNLLGNAVKFTREGKIALRARILPSQGDQEFLQIEVEDSGPGIHPGDLEKIFDAFVQVSNPRMQEGTGLGLSISRQFARLMGGDVTVQSIPGKGTMFQCTVRVVRVGADEVKTPIPSRHVLGMEPGQRRHRVLVADDDTATRRLLIELLTPLGFEVKGAANGTEALELSEHWLPHLILMDIQMPDMDGKEVRRRIKSSPSGRSTTIVALTAYMFKEDREMILREGCEDFMRKPFREEEIYEVLSKHLGVRFVYGEPLATTQPHQVTTPTPPTERSLDADLSGLPEDMVDDLRNAARRADLHGILTLIDQIRPYDSVLAEELAGLAHDFEYGRILGVLAKKAGAS